MKIEVVGSLTIDRIVTGGRSRETPGGSALYTSAAASFLAAKVRLASSVGPDYPPRVFRWLRSHGINLAGVRRVGTPTTRFKLIYRKGSREISVLSPGTTLSAHSLSGEFDAVHFGPVFREIGAGMIVDVRNDCGFLSLDLQGLLRRKKHDGKVELSSRNLGPIFKLCDLVKASEEEAWTVTSDEDPISAARRILQKGPSFVIVTLGRKGSVLAVKRHGMFKVSAYPERNTLDPTGTGDVMVGGWLATFLATKDPVWAASVGSAFSSLVVRRSGLSKFQVSRRELFRRSADVYRRVRTIGDGQ